MPKSKPRNLIELCLYHCDRPDDDCAGLDVLPPGWCAYARACPGAVSRTGRLNITPCRPDGEYVTTDEAARILGITRGGILRQIWNNRLPAVRGTSGRLRRIPDTAGGREGGVR